MYTIELIKKSKMAGFVLDDHQHSCQHTDIYWTYTFYGMLTRFKPKHFSIKCVLLLRSPYLIQFKYNIRFETGLLHLARMDIILRKTIGMMQAVSPGLHIELS